MLTQEFPLTTAEISSGLYYIAFADRQARWTITYFIFTSVCNSIMNFLPLSCQKEPLGVTEQFGFPQPRSC